MKQENDYIKNEVKRLISFLKILFNKFFSTEDITEENVSDINQNFKTHFNISLTAVFELTDEEFRSKFKPLNSSISEELISLFLEIRKKNIPSFSRSKVTKKTLLLLDIIDEKDRTFSFERMKIRNKLR